MASGEIVSPLLTLTNFLHFRQKCSARLLLLVLGLLALLWSGFRGAGVIMLN